MSGTPISVNVSTKLDRIAKLAREMPQAVLRTLIHHVDIEWLEEAHRRTRKDGARGVDMQSAEQYGQDLRGNLQALLERVKAGQYRAPPVRRVHIPKGSGSETRPIGIPTFEDKILQRAVAMLLEAIYEEEFHDFSYGFRPGCSAHEANRRLRDAAMTMGGGWVLEVDIRKFFDTLDHKHLREILSRRVGDKAVLRLIGKWLNAGAMEGLGLSYPKAGTPQGGVISPLLANIYLHEVLDGWFVREVLPRLRGRAELVRYADDFVVVFERKEDAERVIAVLHRRFEKYGLTLHPDKTRLVAFNRPSRTADSGDDDEPGTFNFLGFTFYWGKSLRGFWVVKQRTAKDRLSRALHRVREWCRRHRHQPLTLQHKVLSQQLVGHYGYFGVVGNSRALARFYRGVEEAWRKWLSRRSQRGRITWTRWQTCKQVFPLPMPRIVHRT